jgi:DUF971 family protein
MSGHQTAAPLAVDAGAAGLRVTWPDSVRDLPAAALRSACRCGSCRGAAAAGGVASTAIDVSLVNVEPAGAYGLQLIFSDGHDRGIYPWAMLRDLDA